MKPARSRQLPVREHADAAWERRRNAAWIDYLRISHSAEQSEYEQVELNAWEQLQRRLRRNDELRSAAADQATAPTAH